MLWIHLHILVYAVEGRSEELGVELEQVGADLAAGTGESIERVEVDVRSNRNNNPKEPESALPRKSDTEKDQDRAGERPTDNILMPA
jgi:hypothetical protein